MLSLFFAYHLWLAMTNVTTNERYKNAALFAYFTEKQEFLNYWKQNFDSHLNPEHVKYFQVDENWTKAQLDQQIKKCNENLDATNKNFYQLRSKWQSLKEVFNPDTD